MGTRPKRVYSRFDPELRARTRTYLKQLVPKALLPYVKRAGYRLFELCSDLFPSVRYRKRLEQEILAYSACASVHDLPQIAHYWSHKFLIPMLQPFGFSNSIELFRSYIASVCGSDTDKRRTCLSLGCGDCQSEIFIAQWLLEQGYSKFHFYCYDVNPEVLGRGQGTVLNKQLDAYFTFDKCDINSWKPGREYDIVMAFQSLHHIANLESVFAGIREALVPGGYFLIDDMIGRNGHQRWPEALIAINELWKDLPLQKKYNHQLKRFEDVYDNWDCSKEGFEGIRAQDILPLLLKNFQFDLFIGFGNLIDIFIDRSFGHNFDPASTEDTNFIDRVHALDMAHLESGTLKPTHILAALTNLPVKDAKLYKNLTPEFCVRWPDLQPA